MSFVTIESIVASHPFFAGLSEESLRVITTRSRQVELPADEIIFHEGEAADHFYLIRSGRVALEVHSPRRGRQTIQTIEGGEILGWSWLVPPYQWRFDARVIDPVEAIELDGRRLRELGEIDHDLGYELYRRFAILIGRRLESTRIQLMDLYGSSN